MQAKCQHCLRGRPAKKRDRSEQAMSTHFLKLGWMNEWLLPWAIRETPYTHCSSWNWAFRSNNKQCHHVWAWKYVPCLLSPHRLVSWDSIYIHCTHTLNATVVTISGFTAHTAVVLLWTLQSSWGRVCKCKSCLKIKPAVCKFFHSILLALPPPPLLQSTISKVTLAVTYGVLQTLCMPMDELSSLFWRGVETMFNKFCSPTVVCI